MDRSATVQSVGELEASIRDRNRTDRTFMNYLVYVFILDWITFGLAAIYYYFRRITRVDAYTNRKRRYHAALADFTERYAAASGKPDEVRGDVADLRRGLDEASRSALKPIGALKTFVLTVVTLGLWSIVLIYQLNRAWSDRQEFEAAQMGRLNKVWIKLGIIAYPVVFTPDPSKRRNFLLNVILVIITLGIWGIVWDYRVWTDPNSLYPAFHSVEDIVLTIARAA